MKVLSFLSRRGSAPVARERLQIVLTNITDGIARNGSFELHLTAPEDLSKATITSLAGGIDGQDLTVHWLRPVPPLEHGNARLNFLSPDALEIVVSSARQAGGSAGGPGWGIRGGAW